jgi:hypothetical protein
MGDEILEEKFRELMLKLERIQGEFASVRLRIGDVDRKVDRLVDEVTLPSGRVGERFSAMEQQIQQLGEKQNAADTSKRSS